MTRQKTTRNRAKTLTELTERLANTSEIRFPIAGHAAGEVAFIAARRKGEDWAVVDNNAGHDRGPDYWNGTEWLPLQGAADSSVFRFTEQEANGLAKHYAGQAAEIHQVYAAVGRPEFLDWLVGKAEYVIAAAKAVA